MFTRDTFQSGNFVLDRGFFNFHVGSPARAPVAGHPATDPDQQTLTTRVPVRPNLKVTYVPPSVRHFMEGEGEADSGFQWWWTAVVHGPMNVIEKLWITTRMAVGWVVWNYTDWVSEFSNWDGTWTGLLTRSHLIWRSMVVGLLTLGLLEIAPLLDVVARWIGMIFELIRVAFRLGSEGVEELWTLVVRVYEDIVSLVRMF